jgi:hypothetical protein
MKLQVCRTRHDSGGQPRRTAAARFSEEEPVSCLLGIWQGMLACPVRSTPVYPPVHSMPFVPSVIQTALHMSM